MKPCITWPKPGDAGLPVDRLAGGGGLQEQVVALRLQPGLVGKHRELQLARRSAARSGRAA